MQKPLVNAWQRYRTACEQAAFSLPETIDFYHSLWHILASSDYVTNIFCQYVHLPIEFFNDPSSLRAAASPRHPDIMDTADKPRYVGNEKLREDFLQEWKSFALTVTDEASMMEALRHFRHKAITRIIWRDLLNLSSFSEHLQELSTLADVCVQIATDFIYQLSCQQWGTPCNEQGEPQLFVILAVGKLGGSELNLSSDIDLIFTYPEDGMTCNGSRKITNQQFFTKVGQQLIKALADITVDGFVYRVDMRLRPYGQSGNLVMNFNAIENYYQYQGREWERYALIKARVITGKPEHAKKLMSLLHPFVYRRYLDYGAFEALREMRELVANEVKRRLIKKDIKQGEGGIRQIEFLVQAFQLIRGGQNQQFQHQQLLVVLSRLAQSGYLDKNVCIELEKAYIFLRRTEHRIQMMHDHQTHVLPKLPLDRSRLYFTMGYQNWVDFQAALKRHLNNVSRHFNNISSTPNTLEKEAHYAHFDSFSHIWSCLDENETKKSLEKMGYKEADTIQHLLLQFKESRSCQRLKKHAISRLDKIMRVIIMMIAKKNNQVLLMTRMLRLMQSIARRSAYLALLLEKPQALAYLINIAQESEWVLEQICTYPVLLDELLSPPLLREVIDKSMLEHELEQRINWLPVNDLEGQMDHLRQFKLACFLHVATLEIFKTQKSIDIPHVLNDITEVILTKVYDLSLDFMLSHYGIKENANEMKQKIPFGIIAYGKVGARELNYASDLDLVFLYDMVDDKGIESHQKTMTAADFSLRLAQRIIHMLSTHTASGTLYEVDVRLRPAGSAGLLVSPILAFAKYLREQAWTFEHQALVKARMVAGPQILEAAFEELRAEILTKKRSPEILRNEISEMRLKMHEQHRQQRKNELKLEKGGLTDIEFIVEYFMLSKSRECPSLLTQRSSVPLLQLLIDYQLMETNDATGLISAYTHYQMLLRRKICQPDFEIGSDAQLQTHLQNVRDIWNKIFNSV